MKLPFFQDSGNEEKDSQESTEVATLEPEATEFPEEQRAASEEPVVAEEPVTPEDEFHATESDEPVVELEMPPMPTAIEQRNPEGMRNAFAGVAAAVDGEFESLRQSLADLQNMLGRAVEGEKHARNHAVDGIQQSLTSRIDEVVASREKIVGELKLSIEQENKRMDGSVEELRQAAGRYRERMDGRLEDLKAAVHQSIDAKVEKLSNELNALGKNLSAFQAELKRQSESSQKVMGVLNNMAGVLAGNQTQPSPAPVAAAQPAGGEARPNATGSADSAEPGVSAETGAPAEVDDALERVFK